MVEAVDIAEAVGRFDSTRTALEFWKQEELVVLPEFLPPETVGLIRRQVDRSQA